ncbi:hypothetical protein [Burkholderia lata]|uniref:hypothetical protein n=1 Tax=Burkholderia lata (strain ATCC 17760 / DSM 23089 / LMG 22485 / NCIMB 9086 / R18194 / 383) TaxID=482957 RepID=UPI0015825859|nr:hypothetical protein [Burkholderia lata]
MLISVDIVDRAIRDIRATVNLAARHPTSRMAGDQDTPAGFAATAAREIRRAIVLLHSLVSYRARSIRRDGARVTAHTGA